MEIHNEDLGATNRGAKIALSSFVACRHPVESCRHNGLPLTPNSIAILGQSQRIKTLKHPNLCTFLECQRGKGERIVCASEFYDDNLSKLDLTCVEDPSKLLLEIGEQVLQALTYLKRKNIIHTNLRDTNIVFAGNCAKLFDYYLGHITNYGSYVSFPVFVNPRVTAPEVFAYSGEFPDAMFLKNNWNRQESEDEEQDSIVFIEPAPPLPPEYCTHKCSTWSLGVILFCKSLGIKEVWEKLNVAQTIRKILVISNSCAGKSAAERLAKEHNVVDKFNELPTPLKSLIEQCLMVDVDKRPYPDELLSNKDIFPETEVAEYDDPFTFPTLKLRCLNLQLNGDVEPLDKELEAMKNLNIQEVFYLWQLAGGDCSGELRKHGLVVNMPPILNLPTLSISKTPLAHENQRGQHQMTGQTKDKSTLYDSSTVVLDLSQLVQCLADISTDVIYPVLSSPFNKSSEKSNDDSNLIVDDETANLPLVIRERDVRYQFGRIVLYRKLLQSYPFQRPTIWKEARLDSLPLYRSFIWAALLGIDYDVQKAYDEVDKETWTSTDRQIEVDIPRCHQYNHLLASPEGHRKFKRVLKAWVITNPQYVYWQGLDSLAAPFLLLNFNNEALAFACLSAFIPEYLHGMFRKDNSNVIQEYLAKFSHMQAFHDPVLFNLLDGIGFIPDLYAIPWVLTMFAHVFPLHNIFHLWDKLLLGNSSFPLCVALAILYQLRDRLLNAEFNDCILLFSDLPTIDIEKCVEDSIQIFCSTPKSLTFRKFGSPESTSSPKAAQRQHLNHNNLTLNSITLEQQKLEKVPRISGEETLILLGLSKGPKQEDYRGSDRKMMKSRIVVVDVRNPSDFKLGALPESINIPYQHIEEGQADFHNEIGEKLTKDRIGRKVICVAGSKLNMEAPTKLATMLLTKANQSRVCVLHNGIEIFKTLPGVLVVPDV